MALDRSLIQAIAHPGGTMSRLSRTYRDTLVGVGLAYDPEPYSSAYCQLPDSILMLAAWKAIGNDIRTACARLRAERKKRGFYGH
jgi:hypothetical protein